MKLLVDFTTFELSWPSAKGLVTGLKKLGLVYDLVIKKRKLPANLKKVFELEGIKFKKESNAVSELKITFSNTKVNFTDGSRVKKFANIGSAAQKLTGQKRTASVNRVTNETKIYASVNLDGGGKKNIKTGIGFFDHMLEQIARHGNLDLKISLKGDLHVDEHHTVEDTGIALGQAIKEALGSKLGIKRYGFFLPMDDSIASCTIDLGGRSSLVFKAGFKREFVGKFPTELVKEFFKGVSMGLNANLYILADGENDHHKIEAIFKAFAKALNEACRIDDRTKGTLPTTKGTI